MRQVNFTDDLNMITRILNLWKRCESKKEEEVLVFKREELTVKTTFPNRKNVNIKTIQFLAKELERTEQYLQIIFV